MRGGAGFGTGANATAGRTGFGAGGAGSGLGGGLGSNTGLGGNSGLGRTTGGLGTTGALGTGYRAGTGVGGARGGFGLGMSQPHYQAQLVPDPIFTRIWNLRCAYDPDSPAYRFCHVFYNQRLGDDDSYPDKPNNFLVPDWVKICKEAPDPDNLVPCPLYGFDALKERHESQKTMRDQLIARTNLVQAKLREMTSFYATELRGSFERIRQNTVTINQLLMEVVEIEEIQFHQGQELTEEESALLSKLTLLQLNLTSTKNDENIVGSLRRLREKVARDKPRRSGTKLAIDKQTLGNLSQVLKKHQDSLEALEKVSKKIHKTVSTWEQRLSELG